MNRIARHSEQTPARPAWWAVIAVGLATFSVVTTEMLPVGLLTPIAHSLDAPIGNAGLLVSLPALLAALSAPALVMAAGSIDRRRILCGLLGLLVVANIASALAPGMTTMLAARTLVGFCMGGIWAIAGGLALRLVPGRSVGLATALIFGGVAAASVLGVPLGALIGESAGWRWAFGAMAIFSALTLLLHLALVPPLPAAASTRAQQFGAQLRNNHVQIGLLLTLLLVSAHFMAFTYVRPLLVWVSGLPSHWFGALLFAYGGMGIIGNFLAGLVAARHPRATVATISSGLLLTPLLLLALGATAGGGASVLLLWGLAYGGVSVGLMSWMMRAAPRATEVATALYTSTFNAGIAIGAWAGGQVVDGWGLTANLWLPALLAAIALLLALRVRMPQAV